MTAPPEWTGQPVDAAELRRLRDRHGPLAEAVRRLIDATVRTGADEPALHAAAAAIDAVTESLGKLDRDGSPGRWDADTGRPVLFTNPAVGLRNPIAPPMVVRHEPGGRCWSEFRLGAAYEGPPGLVHGGICALVLDQLLGEVATDGLREPRFTGTITVRFLRGTPLGRLRAEAMIERRGGDHKTGDHKTGDHKTGDHKTGDHKTYARGFISDGAGPTVEADGVFITPGWAREGG